MREMWYMVDKDGELTVHKQIILDGGRGNNKGAG